MDSEHREKENKACNSKDVFLWYGGVVVFFLGGGGGRGELFDWCFLGSMEELNCNVVCDGLQLNFFATL